MIQRSSGAGSDIVQKETYTFDDRGGRSLTLRPEGTAPIVRAYLENGLHREPKPVKLYTIATMYRFDRPQAGRYREHTQLSAEIIGSADPAVDAELIQLYVELLRRFDYTPWELQLNSIGDEQVPARVPREAHRVARRSRRRPRRGRTPEAGDEPAPRLRREERARPGGARGRAEDRRVALRRVPRALRGGAGLPRRSTGSRTRWCRRSCGGSTTTRARPSSSRRPRPATPRTRSAPAGATTGSSRSSAASRRRGSASAPASTGSCSRSPTRAPPPSRASSTSSSSTDDKEPLLPLLAELRHRGVAVDIDYAGRSRNAQVKHAQRLDPQRIVLVDGETATIRERGRDDVSVGLGELVARLTA